MFPAAFVWLALYSLVIPAATAHFQPDSTCTPSSLEKLRKKPPLFLNRILGSHDEKKRERGAGAVQLLLEKKVARVVYTSSGAKHNAVPVIATAKDFFWAPTEKHGIASRRRARSKGEFIRGIAGGFSAPRTTPEKIEQLEEHVAQRRAALVSQAMNDDIENCPECQARRRRFYAGYSTGLPVEEVPSNGRIQSATSEPSPQAETSEPSAPVSPEQETAEPNAPEEAPEEQPSPEYGNEEHALQPLKSPSPEEIPDQEREKTESQESTEEEQPASSNEGTHEQNAQQPAERADQEPEEVSGSEAPAHQKPAPLAREGREDEQRVAPQEEAAKAHPERQEEEGERSTTPTPALRRPKPAPQTSDKEDEAKDHELEEGEKEEEVTPDLTSDEKAALEEKFRAGEGFLNKPWLWFYTLAVFPLLTFLILISLAFFT